MIITTACLFVGCWVYSYKCMRKLVWGRGRDNWWASFHRGVLEVIDGGRDLEGWILMAEGAKDLFGLERLGQFWFTGNRPRKKKKRRRRRLGMCVQSLDMSQQYVAQKHQLLSFNSWQLVFPLSGSQLLVSLGWFPSSKARQRTFSPLWGIPKPKRFCRKLAQPKTMKSWAEPFA